MCRTYFATVCCLIFTVLFFGCGPKTVDEILAGVSVAQESVSSSSTNRTDTTPPPAPEDFVASNQVEVAGTYYDNESIKFTWAATTDPEGTAIYSHTIQIVDASDPEVEKCLIENISGSVTTYTVTGACVLSDGDDVKARIKATNALELVGEWSDFTNNIIVDAVDPVIQVGAITAPIAGSGPYTGGSGDCTITWTTGDITDANSGLSSTPITISYTLDGSSWTDIASDQANDGTSDAFLCPNYGSAASFATFGVKITATDNVGNTSSETNTDITINVKLPVLLTPNPIAAPGAIGGDEDKCDITWTSPINDNGGYLAAGEYPVLEYSTNGGSSWTEIYTSGDPDDDGAFEWDCPSVSTTSFKARIKAVDDNGFYATAASSSNSIVDATVPTISITSPVGGEYWDGEVAQTITWSATDAHSGFSATAIKIECATDGTTFSEITAGTDDDEAYSWTPKTDLPVACRDDFGTYKIKITATDQVGNSKSATSSSAFTIDSTDPVVDITAPDGAEEWQERSTYSVTWSTTETNKSTAALYYSLNSGANWEDPNGGTISMGSDDDDDGTFSWRITNIVAADTATVKLKVVVTDLVGRTHESVSDLVFTVNDNPAQDLTWMERTHPSAVKGVTGVTDTTNNQLVIFGGTNSSSFYTDVFTVKFSDSRIRKLNVSGTKPSGRYYHSSIYNPDEETMVIYGGMDAGGYVDDPMWEFDLTDNTWTDLDANTPGNTERSAAIYDTTNDEMILFGYDGYVYSYNFGTNAWTTETTSGTAPACSRGHSAAFYSDKMLVFGGRQNCSTPADKNDLFSYNIATGAWSKVTNYLGSAPSVRTDQVMPIDIAGNVLYIFGGSANNDVYSLSNLDGATNTWTYAGGSATYDTYQIDGADADRKLLASAYDGTGTNNRLLMFGGNDGAFNQSHLFEYNIDTDTFTTLADGNPEASEFSTMVYDSDYGTTGRFILFGGSNSSGKNNEVWQLNAETLHWTQLSPTGTGPSAIFKHAAIYDTTGTNKRMIVFGGNDGSVNNDLFELDFTDSDDGAWNSLSASGTAPSARQMHTAAYDSTNGKMIVYGGYGSSTSTVYNDIFTLDLTDGAEAWSTITAAGAITARYGQCAIYDGTNMYVFGGRNGSTYYDDVWKYVVADEEWSVLTPSTSEPTARYSTSCFFDVGRLYIFGGDTGSSVLNDVWEFDLAATWILVDSSGEGTVTGDTPSVRRNMSFANKPSGGAKVIYGGRNSSTTINNETHSITIE